MGVKSPSSLIDLRGVSDDLTECAVRIAANPTSDEENFYALNVTTGAKTVERLIAAEELNHPHGSANTNTVGDPEFLLIQNGDGRPEVTAMYCLPFTS